VWASAGHHLECVLAAHGSGAAALSHERREPVLNVDVGGGTTKLALALDGRVVSTSAFAVGGRLLAFDADGRLERIDESARIAADAAGGASGGIALALAEPREGIRATVIGASQFTVQVSGKTIHVTEAADLPLRNVPVAAPRLALGDTIVVAEVARAIQAAIERAPAADDAPIALALRWRG